MRIHVAQACPDAGRVVRPEASRLIIALLIAALFATPTLASGLTLSPEATQTLDRIYSGNSDAAIPIARDIEQAHPESPVGFLLEGEAQWWNIYCAACEIKWGQLDAWKRGKKSEDDAYFALADKAIELARAQIAKSDTAEMHVYAGLGFALKARLYSLRDEKRNVAHAGVAARAEFLRALELDPDMADATAGVGLYNYYVDTLSAIARMLRFFMGVPGGNKQEGIRQMRIGIERGSFMVVDSRFYLAQKPAHLRRKIRTGAIGGRPARRALSAQSDFSAARSATSTRSSAATGKRPSIFTPRRIRRSPIPPALPASAISPIPSWPPCPKLTLTIDRG